MADGASFVAVVEISDKTGAVIAAVGQTCDAVDPAALGWLEQCGAIRRADSAEHVSDG